MPTMQRVAEFGVAYGQEVFADRERHLEDAFSRD
jgi:hypothetical protein